MTYRIKWVDENGKGRHADVSTQSEANELMSRLVSQGVYIMRVTTSNRRKEVE